MKTLSLFFVGTAVLALAGVLGIKFFILDERDTPDERPLPAPLVALEDELKALSELHSEKKVFTTIGTTLIPSVATTSIKVLDVLSSQADQSASDVVEVGLQVEVDPAYPVRATPNNSYTFILEFQDADGFTLHETKIEEHKMVTVVDFEGITKTLSYRSTMNMPFNRAIKIETVSMGYSAPASRKEQYKELVNETPSEIHKRLEREEKEKEEAEREEKEKAEREEKERIEKIAQQQKEELDDLKEYKLLLNWGQLKVGMSRSEVISLLGEPDNSADSRSLGYGANYINFFDGDKVVGFNVPKITISQRDTGIRATINARLKLESSIDASRIQVFVSNGSVSLSGKVSSRADERKAKDIAIETRYVRDVKSQLVIEP